MADKVALYNLRAGMVLDRSAMVLLSTPKLAELINSVRCNVGQRLRVVDVASGFFTHKNMLDLMRDGDTGYALIAEKLGIEITPADVEALHAAELIVKKLKPPKPLYDLADPPGNWNVEEYLAISSVGSRGVVTRKTNPNGDAHHSYSISLNQLQRIWKIASAVWAKQAGAETKISAIQASGYNRNGVVGADRVVIGCQTIRRYEIEGVAIQLGWDFPGA